MALVWLEDGASYDAFLFSEVALESFLPAEATTPLV